MSELAERSVLLDLIFIGVVLIVLYVLPKLFPRLSAFLSKPLGAKKGAETKSDG